MTMFSNNLKEILKVKKITQKELAAKLNIPYATVSGWMRQNTLPDVLMAIEIAQMLGTTVEAMVTGKSSITGMSANAIRFCGYFDTLDKDCQASVLAYMGHLKAHRIRLT